MAGCRLHEESTVKAEPTLFDRVEVNCRGAESGQGRGGPEDYVL